jgi:alginate O-acetyltransferase complex protein AlgI
VLFSSPWFFLFLAFVLAALAPPFSVATKKLILAFASCFFYAFWDYRYLGLLLLISVVDYYCASRIEASPTRRAQKSWLYLSLLSNLGILGYFKYYNFFIDNLNGLLPQAASLPHRHILLPAGISFYTFKTLSYVIDVYRRELRPARSLMDYVTFVTFFPELIAGPIVRASVLLPQLDSDIGPRAARLRHGASLFLLGFTKKLLADRLGAMFDPVFADPLVFSRGSAWAALLGYSLQIYCDFSGYSDMAIGTARMIGYRLPENFRMPYLSGSVTEFWRRWHMTLSYWLRDYVYIPLGGSRRGALRTYVNLLLTMLVGGLWHGASWNFVIWGGLHGSALAIERALSKGRGRAPLPQWLKVSGTFAFVTLCWLPFRCSTLGQSQAFVARLLSGSAGVHWVTVEFFVLASVVVLGHVIGSYVDTAVSGPTGVGVTRRVLDWFGATLLVDDIMGWTVCLTTRNLLGAFTLALWVIWALLFAPTQLSPFIYFQF